MLNHLGSPEYIFDESGNQIDRVKMDSFGQDLGSTAGADRHRFTGHERDHVTSLDGPSLPMADHMHARTYVPMLGRFTRPDPANSYVLVDPQFQNRYSYTHNRPTVFTDPDGQFAIPAVAATALEATLALGVYYAIVDLSNPSRGQPSRILEFVDAISQDSSLLEDLGFLARSRGNWRESDPEIENMTDEALEEAARTKPWPERQKSLRAAKARRLRNLKRRNNQTGPSPRTPRLWFVDDRDREEHPRPSIPYVRWENMGRGSEAPEGYVTTETCFGKDCWK